MQFAMHSHFIRDDEDEDTGIVVDDDGDDMYSDDEFDADSDGEEKTSLEDLGIVD